MTFGLLYHNSYVVEPLRDYVVETSVNFYIKVWYVFIIKQKDILITPE